jgi:GAF domain-containing protein
LSKAQEDVPIVIKTKLSGQAVGVFLGCLVGMCPLLWLDTQKADRLRREDDKRQLFDSVITQVAKFFGAEAATVMLLDKERNDLYTMASENMPEFRTPVGTGIMGSVAQTKRFINLADVRRTPLYDEKRHRNYQGTGMDVTSVLCMPILDDGEVVGVVEIINKQGGFSSRDEDILCAVCSHIAVYLHSSENQHLATFSKILDMTESQFRERSLYLTEAQEQRETELFSKVLEEMQDAHHGEASMLLLFDAVKGELATKVAHGLPHISRPLVDRVDLHFGKKNGPLAFVAREGKTLVLKNVDKGNCLFFADDYHNGYLGSNIFVRDYLAVPIFHSGGGVIGVLVTVNKIPGAPTSHFTDQDVEIARTVASHVAVTLEGHASSLRVALNKVRRKSAVAVSTAEGAASRDLPDMRVLPGDETLDVA